MARIEYADCYLPQEWIAVREALKLSPNFTLPEEYASLEDFCEDFQERNKLFKVYVERVKRPHEIFIQLLDRLFAKTGITPEQVGFIFYTNPLNLYIEGRVSIPYYLQKKYNMDNASVIVVDQKCSTSLAVMGLCNSTLKSRPDRYVLILSPCFIQNEGDRYMQFTICGDGAGIMLLKEENNGDGFEIVDFLSVSDGFYSYSVFESLQPQHEKVLGDVDERMKFIEKGVSVIRELLSRNGLVTGDVKLLVPQSVSNYGYYIYSILLKLPMEKVFTDNIPLGGHLGDVDTIRNFASATASMEFEDGDHIVLYGVGSDGTDINYSGVLLCYKQNNGKAKI